MAAPHAEQTIEPTYIRVAADDEATLVDGPGGLPPALRAMVEAELRAIDASTSIGQLVTKSQDVLMTAHLPTDLDFHELLDEDAAAERRESAEIVPLPEAAILEPPTVHAYVEPDRPALRAVTPIGGGESDEFLVRRVEHAEDTYDPYDVSAIAGALEPSAVGFPAYEDEDVLEPLAFPFVRPAGGLLDVAALPEIGDDDPDVTRTFFRIAADDDDTIDPAARFSTPSPRGPATTRGVGPQRYIATQVGEKPLPMIGEREGSEIVSLDCPPPKASPFVVALVGLACVAAMFTQVL